MKILKKIAALCMAISLCVCVGVFAASCGGAGDSSATQSSEAPQTATGYLFKIVDKDGNAVTSYTCEVAGETVTNPIQVQLCQGTTMCFMPVALDDNGQAIYNATTAMGFPGAGVYDIHILGGGEFGTDNLEFEGATQTPANYSTEYIVLTLK